MKVVHISGYCHAGSIGGTERYLLDLIQGLEPNEVENEIGWLTGQSQEPFESEGVPICPLPAPSMRVDEPPASLRSKAEAWLERVNPNVAHFHTFGLAEAEVARIARDANIPCLFTYHSPAWTCRRQDLLIWGGAAPCDGEVRTLRCSACKVQERVGGPAWMGFLGAALSWPIDQLFQHSARPNLRRRICLLSGTRQFRQALREFLQHCAWVVSCSEWGRPVLVANGANPRLLSVIPQGAPEDFAEAGPWAKLRRPRDPGAPFTVGYMGRVAPVKGVDILVEAFSRVAAQDAHLKVFGWEGPDVAGKFTRRLAELARRDSRIELLSKLPLAAMTSAYSRIDLVAIPSVWPETGPLVLFEALQMGVPVFGTNRLGHPGLLSNGGQLVEPNTIESWRVALQEAVTEFRSGRWERRLNKVLAFGRVRSMGDVRTEMLALYRTVARSGEVALL